MQQTKNLRDDLKELNDSYNKTCLTNLKILVQKYESHSKFKSNNKLYKIFKELAKELEESGTIMKYIATHPDIDQKVTEFRTLACIDSEDEKFSSYEYLGLIDDMTETTSKIYSKEKCIPCDMERTRKSMADRKEDLALEFNVYCIIHNVISVDNMIALKGIDFYEKNPPTEEFDKTRFVDNTEAIYKWFTESNKIIDPDDYVEIKAWFLTKYICLTIYYDNVEIIN